MQVDVETVRWVLSALFCAGGGIISWLIARQVKLAEDDIAGHEKRIVECEQHIVASQIDIAKNYVSKMELEKQLDTHIGLLREDMRDIKGDLKQLLKRP